MVGAAVLALDEVDRDLLEGEHRSSDHRARSPLAKVPVLELDDGRYLGETRAICSYLE
ncbi:glutathione S-transferase N-terminal domain-containing protein, partial [Thauera aminoaromatica]